MDKCNNIRGYYNMKKMISLLLVTIIVFSFAACSQPAESAGTSASMPAQSGSGSEAIPEPEVLNQAFLTGLSKGADYPEGQRIAAVMVNNIAQSRPTRGLSEAQILVEIKVEGGITRFMAIYEDYTEIPMVGSMRSARDQFFQLLLPFWGFYMHEGPAGESPVNWLIRDYDYEEFDIQPDDGDLRFQDPARAGWSSEFTWYTDAEHIMDTIATKGSDDYRSYGSPIFNFVPYTEPARVPEDGEAAEVAVIHSASYISHFSYNESTSKYDMSQFNSYYGGVDATIDENNGDQLAFDNVIVLFAPMTLWPDSQLVKVDYSVGGAGYYISQGQYELIFWRKGAENHPLILERADRSGEQVLVNPGTTYLAIVDDEELGSFDAHLQAGTAGEAAEGGEVNQDEVETEE